MSTETFRDLLLTALDRSAELRARVVEDAAFSERRARLRAWQAARLARTHRDLLESGRFHDAAEFFLISWEFPRLCRGGSRSLTFAGVHRDFS